MDSSGFEGTIRELVNLPTLAHPTVSPGGTEVAMYYDGPGRNEIHVLDLRAGTLEQWSDGDVPRTARWSLQWAADGSAIYFPSNDGQNGIHAIDRDGNVERVLEMDGLCVLQAVGRDGETLLVASTADGQLDLYCHDLSTGRTRRITDNERAVGYAQLSPDGEYVSYCTNESSHYTNDDVYVVRSDGTNRRRLDVGETGAEAAPADWHPDGEKLLFGDTTTDLGRYGVYDLNTDSVTWFGDTQYEENPLFFMPDGERFLVTRHRDASIVPVVYDVDSGAHRELDLPDGVVEFDHQNGIGRCQTSTIDDDRVLLVQTTATNPGRVIRYDLRTDEYDVLFEIDDDPPSRSAFSEPRYLTVQSNGVPSTDAHAVAHDSADEFEIELLLYDSGERPSSLVVNPHGGPRSSDLKRFSKRTQFLTLQGHSVLQVNYRGSVGRGREFIEALYGDWGGAEQGDIATAVEHVLGEYDWLDEDRVAVFGSVYGGYSAYWQLLQYPELYCAGAGWLGVTDLEALYEDTLPQLRTESLEKYLGKPEEHPELYEQRSPITHAENLDSPLLLLHDVNDRRIPISQARTFKQKLEANGLEEGPNGDFEYVELRDEDSASNGKIRQEQILEHLGRFLERRL